MQVRIGVTHIPREIEIELPDDADADSVRSLRNVDAFEWSSELLRRAVLCFQSVITVREYAAGLRVRNVRSIRVDREHSDQRYQ